MHSFTRLIVMSISCALFIGCMNYESDPGTGGVTSVQRSVVTDSPEEAIAPKSPTSEPIAEPTTPTPDLAPFTKPTPVEGGNSNSPAEPTAVPNKRGDLDVAAALQGTWKVIPEESTPGTTPPSLNAYWVFAGNRLEMRLEKKVVRAATFTVDASKTPPVIVGTWLTLPGRNPAPVASGDMPFELLEGNTKLRVGGGVVNHTLKFLQ